MFQLRIEGVVGAKFLLDGGWPTRAVSLLAPKLRGWEPRGPHHLIQRFEDIDSPHKDWVPPSMDFIVQALTFTQGLTDRDKLLVNCHMGCRRSPALALGVLIQHGMSPTEAYAHVKQVRPMANPNHFMTRLIDELYELDGELIGAIGLLE